MKRYIAIVMSYVVVARCYGEVGSVGTNRDADATVQ